MTHAPPWTELFEHHRRDVWGVCYRMTGSAADADDILQETFARAIARPPKDLDRPLRPWLIRVAINQARDLLRARKRRDYTGSWLPTPVPIADPTPTAAGRYTLLESATLAFLTAIEALSPQQRAVLLLRDVLDYTTAETAEALSLSTANVKTTLHRARARMKGYDQRPCRPTPALVAQSQDTLHRFVAAVATGDHTTMANLLAEDARYTGDSNGHYWNATRTIQGRERVKAFLLGVSRKSPSAPKRIDPITCNGLPALLLEVTPYHPRIAPRSIVQATVTPSGLLQHIYLISAPDKLAAWT